MTRLNSLLLSLLLAAALLAGCDGTPADRIAALERQADLAQQVVDQAAEAVPLLESSSQQLRTVLADPAIDDATRDTALALLVKADARIEQLKTAQTKASAYLLKVAEAIDTLHAGGEITQWDELQFYGQLGAQIGQSLPPPYGGWVLLGSSLLTLIGGLIGGAAKQKLDDKQQLDAKEDALEEIVESVNKLLDGLETPTRTAAKQTLKAHQSPATRAAVMEIKQA